MRFTLRQIAEATGARLLGSDDPEQIQITGFATDSRQAGPGYLFVPIHGENVDGHQFIGKAFENGAAATFSDHEVEAAGPVLVVPDPRRALQQFAGWYRSTLSLPIVGITGSVGKTTSKELIAQALTAGFHVWKTPGNANSQVGVPITVCQIAPEHTAAVIEMGVSMPGEMERIAGVVRPTLAVMTNIGVSHLEYMKTRENILAEKSRIADHLPAQGALLVNGDDDLLPTLKETSPHRVVTFGLHPDCDWRALEPEEQDTGTRFMCAAPDGARTEVFVPAAGLHNVRNALAAMAVASELGIPAASAARAIAGYEPPAMRLQIREVRGVTLLDDSYNASPDSMRAALDVLAGRKIPGRRFAVLADMKELGDYAAQGHRETGRYARQVGVDCLAAVGPLARDLAQGYGEGAVWFADNAGAIAWLKERLAPGDALLVKGSRSMHTEEIAAAIAGE